MRRAFAQLRSAGASLCTQPHPELRAAQAGPAIARRDHQRLTDFLGLHAPHTCRTNSRAEPADREARHRSISGPSEPRGERGLAHHFFDGTSVAQRARGDGIWPRQGSANCRSGSARCNLSVSPPSRAHCTRMAGTRQQRQGSSSEQETLLLGATHVRTRRSAGRYIDSVGFRPVSMARTKFSPCCRLARITPRTCSTTSPTVRFAISS
jgi:hypothetical protein